MTRQTGVLARTLLSSALLFSTSAFAQTAAIANSPDMSRITLTELRDMTRAQWQPMFTNYIDEKIKVVSATDPALGVALKAYFHDVPKGASHTLGEFELFAMTDRIEQVIKEKNKTLPPDKQVTASQFTFSKIADRVFELTVQSEKSKLTSGTPGQK